MFERMILQTSFRHELILQQLVVTIRAIANELYKILVEKLPKVVDLRLQQNNCGKLSIKTLLVNLECKAKAW
jgi:hypothetical protein